MVHSLFNSHPCRFDIELVAFKQIPAALGGAGTATASYNLDGALSNVNKANALHKDFNTDARQREPIIRLNKPFFTSEITFSKLSFGAWTDSRNKQARLWKLGHNIRIQMELFGCFNLIGSGKLFEF